MWNKRFPFLLVLLFFPVLANSASTVASYIQPSLAQHIDAPLPEVETSDQVVGIYGNIFYPQDQEQIQLRKLHEWIEAYGNGSREPFPLSQEEIKDISLFVLERFPLKTLSFYFVNRMQGHLKNDESLENALKKSRQETLIRASLYRKIAQNIPPWKGRTEVLGEKFIECADQAKQIVDQKIIRENLKKPLQPLLGKPIDLIEPPFTWEIRIQVFKQMIDKVLSVSPHSPYFLALQEVTPQALNDLKTALADRNLQWISFNNISGKETLAPRQEEVLGEATGFTSTMAISQDLEILKIELGDLPTESGSVRKILGVRVRNRHTNDVLNLFTTHTDHKIQNDIYLRTAEKIHEFATQFFQDDPSGQRFVIGGDLNAFEQSGGDKYLERLRELFPNSQDFRETNYYAPNPIAWSSFIGRPPSKGIVESNALDHILVGNGIELHSSGREAAVYNGSGELLDYYKEKDEYLKNLQNRMTFSDHFFNIVRFKVI